ncbi:MAG: SUMF1/EgtB/PvdO family nonheme iron enzyme [Myxococcales bacterium]|nr:SUMF1/EgtB/PvdO family nonheme iron enzyme [Myxococcales bacterium]
MQLRDLTDRYRLEGEVGRGSIGVVHRAVDLVLDRQVAVKVLRSKLLDHARHRPRFLREAMICARLGHPNIVPVFDVGALSGAPCLVMALLAGRSLRTIIRSGRMSVARQLSWFTQVCNGVAFAHQQGIIHRDIKPAHVFVGDFGQVVLTDWGLAKAQRWPADEAPAPVSHEVTRVGDVVGTPAYMAPEQAEGRVASLDHRTDIYALGAVLYEILTGTRPYEASRSIDVLRALRRGPPDPPRQRAPHRNIPAALEAVCMQAMARDPGERFDSALDLAANIEAHFDARQAEPQDRTSGSVVAGPPQEAESTATQQMGPPAEAARHLADGRAEVAAFERQLRTARAWVAEAARLEATLPYEASRPERARAWKMLARARDTQEQAAWHLAQGVEALNRAAVDPIHRPDAREALARLHRDAWRAADEVNDIVAAAFHRARAEIHDDGPLAAELAGRATLTVNTVPPQVAVDFSACDDRGAVWSTGAQVHVGHTPLSGRTVNAARLVVRLRTDDGLSVRLPLRLRPGETRAVDLTLPRASHVPPGFLFVPGGRFIFGFDDHAPGAAEPRDTDVGSFCMARQPVTWEQYFEFLEDLLAVDADAAPHLPRVRESFMVTVEDRRVTWKPNVYAPRGAPMRYVSHADAQAYAEWLGRRLGVTLRLPTEIEWEYAAGGADGRAFPWGDRFVPGLADTRRRGSRGPAPVGAFADDESPFGMRGVAGGVREWTATLADEPGRYLLRGGSWRAWPDHCRVGARATGAGDLTHQAIGIRLAADVPPLDTADE